MVRVTFPVLEINWASTVPKITLVIFCRYRSDGYFPDGWLVFNPALCVYRYVMKQVSVHFFQIMHSRKHCFIANPFEMSVFLYCGNLFCVIFRTFPLHYVYNSMEIMQAAVVLTLVAVACVPTSDM